VSSDAPLLQRQPRRSAGSPGRRGCWPNPDVVRGGWGDSTRSAIQTRTAAPDGNKCHCVSPRAVRCWRTVAGGVAVSNHVDAAGWSPAEDSLLVNPERECVSWLRWMISWRA
jgi:hypothetical protein